MQISSLASANILNADVFARLRRGAAARGREEKLHQGSGLAVTSCNLFRGRHQPHRDLAPLAPAPLSHQDFLSLDINTLLEIETLVHKYFTNGFNR